MEELLKDTKICVTKNRNKVLCFVTDIDNDYNVINLYEVMGDFTIETIMSGDVVLFKTEKDIKEYTKYFDESEIDLITHKEMLEHLLKESL